MIWRRTASNHAAAIGSFARQWLGGTMLDRLIPVTIVGFFWFGFWGLLGILSQDGGIFLFCLLIGLTPWSLWLLDARLDAQQVETDIAAFALEGAILATRCEYLGGHPQLPHGRFAYLLLEGTQQNPNLTLVFPTGALAKGTTPPAGSERFILPILDLKKMKPEQGSDASPAADIAAVINKDVGRFLRPERLTLVIDFDGPGGRTHKVELTNFFQGNNEIRNWRNYLVCAQAQADTGITPHAPWVSLPPEPDEPTPTSSLEGTTELETSDAFSRNGHTVEEPSSAFVRR
jgi:hypothetical protein